MWFILSLLFDSDTYCDPITLTTNLGHVCEVVVERMPRYHYTVFTTRGTFPASDCPIWSKPVHGTEDCEKTSFTVLYESVTVVKTSSLWKGIPMKGGMWRPFGPDRYVCRDNWHMNKEGNCEMAYLQRKRR